MILKPTDRAAWLDARKRGLGGSDAGTAVGVNRYKSNVELWREKTGLTEPEDIGDKPAVKFGKQAEEHLRALFALEHPEFALDYHEFFMYVSDTHPFIYATLDGELTDENGRRGVLEIKTATINNSAQWGEWLDKDRQPKIPDAYYAQILHQLAATGWDFVILYAYIRTPYGGTAARILERHIERADVENDIQYLIGQETAFWQAVEQKRQPPRILPDI